MCVREDGTIPEFYQEYVKEVQEIIRRNAALEFEAIWREHERTGLLRSVLSDRLSLAITSLDEELQKTALWDNVGLRRAVLQEALPRLLLNLRRERASTGQPTGSLPGSRAAACVVRGR